MVQCAELPLGLGKQVFSITSLMVKALAFEAFVSRETVVTMNTLCVARVLIVSGNGVLVDVADVVVVVVDDVYVVDVDVYVDVYAIRITQTLSTGQGLAQCPPDPCLGF